jgi:MoxR-like ATPase
MSKELVRLLRKIAEVSGKLYSTTLQDKDLRVCKGAKRLAELAEEGVSAEEAIQVLKKEGLVLSAEENSTYCRN